MPKSSSNPLDRFALGSTDIKPRIIGLSIGEVGTRKTTFWLEGPAPIVVFSFDRGTEGVVERVINETGKEIRISEYDWSPTDELGQDEAIELRDKFAEDFEIAIQHARTVIVDKEGDLWELYRYAEFGAPNDAPRNYPSLNQRYRKLINMVKATDINCGFIEGMKDEWVSKTNKKTGAQGAVASGGRIRTGFGELDGLVHQVLTHSGTGPSTWSVHVGKTRGPGGHEIAEQDFPGLSFSDYAQLVFPDSQSKDWE